MPKGVKVKKFLLEVSEGVWNKCKDTVPCSISLNKTLIDLLREKCIKNEKRGKGKKRWRF